LRQESRTLPTTWFVRDTRSTDAHDFMSVEVAAALN
jgi:hypothetical protein